MLSGQPQNEVVLGIADMPDRPEKIGLLSAHPQELRQQLVAPQWLPGEPRCFRQPPVGSRVLIQEGWHDWDTGRVAGDQGWKVTAYRDTRQRWRGMPCHDPPSLCHEDAHGYPPAVWILLSAARLGTRHMLRVARSRQDTARACR
jgi:hypothetical protein